MYWHKSIPRMVKLATLVLAQVMLVGGRCLTNVVINTSNYIPRYACHPFSLANTHHTK